MSVGDQQLLEKSCMGAVAFSLGLTESLQGAVIEEYKAEGVSARLLPPDLLAQLSAATDQVLNEEAVSDEDFARVLQSQRDFLGVYLNWRNLAYPAREQAK